MLCSTVLWHNLPVFSSVNQLSGSKSEDLNRCCISEHLTELTESVVEMLMLAGVGAESDPSLDADADQLLPDLQKYVDEDNDRFEAELMAWDCEQRKKASRASGSAADSGAGDTATATTGMDRPLSQSLSTYL